jgi:hypothetical protein
MIIEIINKGLSMLWSSFVCLDCFNFKSLSWKVCGSNLNNWSFKFIKILAQIMNKFSKVWQNKK